jgi:phosphate transport system substrate-binding protein
MADALNGLVDIGMVSREIDASEVEKGAFGISVVKDAVLPTANRESPFADRLASHGLTKTLFKELFVSGSLTDWNQVFGLSGSGGKINVYVRSDSCGAGEVWGKYLGVKQEDLNGIGIYGDPGIAEAVSRDADGVGFNNLNYAFDSNTTLPVGNLMIIPIDLNEDGVIDDGESFYSNSREVMQAIADGRYPSPPARELYLVTKGKPSGQVKDFIQWILADGQQYVVESGYIALKPDSLSEQVNKVS